MNTPTTPSTAPAILTSFAHLFGRDISGITIREIEIPLIQRDYAQGRKTEMVKRIRDTFIDALCKPLNSDVTTLDLDFVFGDVKETSGKFLPLDGQQRLTTLFLLHCYLAWRSQTTPQTQMWHRFSYATRPGARDFCGFLTQCQPDFSGSLSAWIKDQADYLPTWQHDPTIQSMLVVLDALHERFLEAQPADVERAWERLMDKINPAIRFHLLPMRENGLTDALYIKMNSRGKPLTPFENFKAHFEEMLENTNPEEGREFANKVDTDWSDILWPYRGDDNLIDDEFMCYFRFVTEVCAWKSGVEFKDVTRDDATRDEALAALVYGSNKPIAKENTKFLLQSFNNWKDKNVKKEFDAIFTRQTGSISPPLLMFNFNSFDKEGVDLFHACCRHYGTRQWTLAHTLLLYGVLLKAVHQVDDVVFSTRLRILRNLIEASSDEIRAGERNNMPKLVVEVENIIVRGDLQQVNTFNQVQARNEINKAAMLQSTPALQADLYLLEDHDLLRGGLTVFEHDPLKFTQRVQAFVSVFNKTAGVGNMPWKLITGALLAEGDYSRKKKRFTGHYWAEFGAPKNVEPWQALFRGKKGEGQHPTTAALMTLLDDIASGKMPQNVIDAYLNDQGTLKDWRYYFVKYDVMREGASGLYTINSRGYQVCMLDKSQMNSYYRDPYLLSMVQKSEIATDKIKNSGSWFYGYETDLRMITLKGSGIQIQCVDDGWQITNIPTEPAQKASYDAVCAKHKVDDNGLLAISQQNGIDTLDRVEIGAKLLSDLVADGVEFQRHDI